MKKLLLMLSLFSSIAFAHQTPWGWKINPVGKYISTPNFPTNVVVSKHHVFVLTNGATPYQTINMYDKNLREVFQVRAYPSEVSTSKDPHMLFISYQNLYQGLYYKSHKLYVAGGDFDNVLVFDVKSDKLVLDKKIHLDAKKFPKNQYPYIYQGARYDLRHFFTSCVYESDGYIYACGLLSNAIARINEKTQKIDYVNVGPYPYDITSNNKYIFVSLWGNNSVAVLDKKDFKLIKHIELGKKLNKKSQVAGMHPTNLYYKDGKLFVSLANTNKIGIIDTKNLKVSDFLEDKMFKNQEVGSYPNSMFEKDGKLFVSSAGLNAVNIFDLKSKKLIGSVPTGWYPSSMTKDNKNIYIVSAKGLGSYPNPNYYWIGIEMPGLLQKVSFSDISKNLNTYTKDVYAYDNLNDMKKDKKLVSFLRHHIKYVVFILRENKTFDEEFGTYKRAGAWADPNLAVYGEKELPNLFNFANNYVLMANFYADGEVTAQGHQWTAGANSSDFVERTWAQYYSRRGLMENPGWISYMGFGLASGWGGIPIGKDNPFAIYEDLKKLGKWSNPWISYPYKLYLFNNLLKNHVSFEDFGEFVTRNREGDIPPSLKKHIALSYPGWDRFILDTYRADEAIKWLKSHKMPRFLYIWLPDDHTAGFNPCYYTPNYYVANNDYATAKIVEYLSHTPYWKHMAIFITEDDAQSGADHIDAHRTFAVVISPWVKKGYISYKHYSQINIVKTIEEILGIPPMSIYDQTASIFTDIWSKKPNFSPIKAIKPKVKVAFNKGYCPDYTLLRREAGVTGNYITPEWLKKHKLKKQRDSYNIDPKHLYTPTSLLKVSGFEQFRQTLIATKGEKGYKKMMDYIKRLAKKEHKSIWAFISN
ncbi:alkaline phosphatase family protein [Hydrogenobaculum acidophilum]